jgi:riboflavin synthase
MFTGIVEQVGKVISLEEKRGQMRALIQTKFTDLALGESIAINGVCLTVSESTPKGEAHFFLSEETLACSNLKVLEAGSRVNVERALTLSSRLSGHMVQGHVDTTGTLLNIAEGSEHHKLSIALDPKYGRYCVEKGSIAINGVSLTINSLTETKQKEFIISVLVIPHTWQNTNFSDLKIGAPLNVEVDVLAKYIERLCPNLQQPLNG